MQTFLKKWHSPTGKGTPLGEGYFIAGRESAAKLAQWIDDHAPEALPVFNLPEAHRKKLRTTNNLERLNKEIKRRTRVATLFPNEPSLERLVTALLSEISDEWETGKTYPTKKNQPANPAR